MRSRLLSILAFTLCSSLSACATDARTRSPLLASAAGIEVSGNDLRSELRLLRADSLDETLGSETQLGKTIESLYLRKRMSQLAGELGYLDRELVQSQLKRDRELRLAGLTPQIYAQELAVPDQTEKAREYYAAHPAEFTAAETVRVSQIFLRAPTEADKKRRRPEAAALLARAKAGENFGELSAEHSEDGSKFTLGDLGHVKRGTMVPEFDAVAFGMTEPGQLSDLVESRFGWHIIRFTDRQAARPIPFEDVRAQLVAKLEGEYRKQAVKAWRSAAVAKDVLSLSDEQLAALLVALRSEFGVPAPEPAATAPEAATETPAETPAQAAPAEAQLPQD